MTERAAPNDVVDPDDEDEFDEEYLELVAGAGMTWSYTKVRDWIILDPELRGTPFHLYCLLRSLLFEKGGNRLLRNLTIDEICFLLPGVNNKPTSESVIKDTLKILIRRGLVTSPRGRVATSGGRGQIRATRRLQLNDIPELPFDGWINPYDKLKDYRQDWRTRPVTPPRYVAEQAPADPVATECSCGCHGTPTAGHAAPDVAPKPAAPAAEARPSLHQQAQAVAKAWIDSRAARGLPIPELAPAAITRSAAALLRERTDFELLCAAAADVGPRGWTDLRKHLERWTPPVPGPRADAGATSAAAVHCPWCDPWGWFESDSGAAVRCKHPRTAPAGHSAALPASTGAS